MKKFIPDYKVFESMSSDNYWYNRLEDSYKNYMKSDLFWQSKNPINKILKEKNLLGIFSDIAAMGESFNLNLKDLSINHYISNDFTINWGDDPTSYPSISFKARTKEDEEEDDDVITKPTAVARRNNDDFNSNIHPNHILIEVFRDKHHSTEFTLISKNDIDDIILDINEFLSKKEMILNPNIPYRSEKTWFECLSRYLTDIGFRNLYHPDYILDSDDTLLMIGNPPISAYNYAFKNFKEGKTPKEVGDVLNNYRKNNS